MWRLHLHIWQTSKIKWNGFEIPHKNEKLKSCSSFKKKSNNFKPLPFSLHCLPSKNSHPPWPLAVPQPPLVFHPPPSLSCRTPRRGDTPCGRAWPRSTLTNTCWKSPENLFLNNPLKKWCLDDMFSPFKMVRVQVTVVQLFAGGACSFLSFVSVCHLKCWIWISNFLLKLIRRLLTLIPINEVARHEIRLKIPFSSICITSRRCPNPQTLLKTPQHHHLPPKKKQIHTSVISAVSTPSSLRSWKPTGRTQLLTPSLPEKFCSDINFSHLLQIHQTSKNGLAML